MRQRPWEFINLPREKVWIENRKGARTLWDLYRERKRRGVERVVGDT